MTYCHHRWAEFSAEMTVHSAIAKSTTLLSHNVLSSSNVVEVGQILFFINQTLQMILTVLVIVVDWCAHLFWCLGPLLGSLGGPCRGPGGPQISQNSVSCFDCHQFSKNRLCWSLLELLGDTFLGPLRPKLTALDVFDNVQPCSTLFNQCSTHLGSLGLSMANYGHIWPKRVILGGSGAPQCHFWGVKRVQTDPPRCEV